ncbi:hypothetical protein CLV59_10999 [Chitinophaga dinghuensis]|uniref:DUF1735 domain-containing protein n=1 Tax=Chitinophaga dinghuensis TaxID=1539050 RepID=A0A327VNU3_9BACT|nr:hypothetical protein [Chitinophaga dinghuensis]RAJ75485.1 hypothetical protein CLV59_10999 [Chitinophaga dinghuensis]
MKKLNSLMIMLLAVCLFFACRKNDNPKLPDGIVKSVLPQLSITGGGDVIIQQMSAFKTNIGIALYFPNGEQPQKMDLRVIYNGNYNNVQTLQANITSFPATVTVTGPQLAQLFGLNVNNPPTGTSFTVAPDITLKNGKVIQAFTTATSGTSVINLPPYGTDPHAFPNIALTLNFPIVCPLNMHLYAPETGYSTLNVQDPDFWGDYTVRAQIGTGADTATLTLLDWVQIPNAKVVANVNVKTQQVTVPTVQYSTTLPGTPYHNPTVGGSGNMSTCDTSIILSLTNKVTEGNFGVASTRISVH